MAAAVFLACAAVLQVVPVWVWRARPLAGVSPLAIRAISGWLLGTIVFVALALQAR